jgi:hypothetical protein
MYACLRGRLDNKAGVVFRYVFDRSRAVHAGAAFIAHARKMELLPIANFDFHEIVESAPRASAPTAKELVWRAFALPPRLTRVEKVDQVAPMNQNRPVPIDSGKPELEPIPDGVTVQAEQVGGL